VKRPPGSPPVFKARYVARGFSQRQGVDFFQTFSPTPKMTTLRVLLLVATQRDYELHSLDFNTAFLQGSLHEEIWLRHPPGFTGSFPAGTQWSLRRPVYGLRQAPREWHDSLRTTLAALGFAPSTSDPSLFLRTDTTLPPFYVLVYVDELVFATADTEALAHVKSELQKRHTCTDLGELTSYLGLRITRDRAQRTITLTQSHMVQQVLQRFGFTYSSPRSTPLPTGHSLSAPPSDESVEPSGPYPELVGCLMYLMTCTRPDLAYPLSLLARCVAPGRHRKRSSQGYTLSLGSGGCGSHGDSFDDLAAPECPRVDDDRDRRWFRRCDAADVELVMVAAEVAVEAVEEAERVAVEVGVVPGVGASMAAVEIVASVAEVVEAAAAVVEVEAAVVLVEVQPPQRGGFGGSQRQQQLRTRETPSVQQLPQWYTRRGRSGSAGPCTYVLRTATRSGENVPIFDLDFDAIIAAMYALADITEVDYYLSVPPDPGTTAAALGASAAAALGASASAAPGTCASAAPGAGTSTLSCTAPTESFHTFTLDSGASRSFFRDSTTLMPLSRPVAVSLADPSRGPVLPHSSTVLPCPAAPSGLLLRLHLPSFSTNLVSGADLQDAWVDQFTPGGQRVTHCTCSRTGRHLAMFTRRPGSSLYTLTTAPPPVPTSGQVAASSQVFAAASRSSPESAPCSYRPLAHKTLLWHHRLGHPSLPRLRGMASRALVSGLPRSLPPLPPGPAPTCVPCVEGRQRAAPHSSTFPPTEAPLQTLHMDVWGPARVRGQGHERYFLLVVDDYSRYTTVFPLRSKGEVPEVLIDRIRGARRQLSESFGSDLPVLRLHSDRGGEFSSDLLRAFCHSEGIRQTFTLPASPQQNGNAERRIGMVMDVARTSMIHAAAPHFLWPFAVQYAAHQINLQPRVSLPETTPTLRWTGKVGDASAFRVWGSRAFVRETTANKLSSCAVPCVFLGFPLDAPGWQFYHPTSRRLLSSQDVTFDKSVSYYHLFPYRTASPPPPAALPGTRYSPDPSEPVKVAVDSGAQAGGAEPAGAGTGGAESAGAEPVGAETGGAESGGAEC
ncbi:unnamed protein product, partial [Closterium sp. NIES-53]